MPTAGGLSDQRLIVKADKPVPTPRHLVPVAQRDRTRLSNTTVSILPGQLPTSSFLRVHLFPAEMPEHITKGERWPTTKRTGTANDQNSGYHGPYHGWVVQLSIYTGDIATVETGPIVNNGSRDVKDLPYPGLW